LLLENFIGEVPREHEHVIGLNLEKRVRRANRNVLARHVFAMLVDVAVHNEVDEVASNARGVDQRGTLGRRRIGSNRGALGLETLEDF
jgi:hypothetical protein